MKMSERYKEKLSGELDVTSSEYNDILLQLEVTNACNHRCYFCPNKDSIRRHKMMDINFAKRIIRECSEFMGDNAKICYHMNGEPLLYKDLTELVKYSKELGYSYCFLTTNGSAATEEMLMELFDAGLDSIKFSINAGTRETYKMIHGKDDFDKVIDTLKFVHRYREESNKNYSIYVSCVGTKDNVHELEKFDHDISDYCDEIVFYYPCGYAGQNNSLANEMRCDMSNLKINTFDIKHNSPCNVLWNSINVTCEGYLSLCCSESDNRLIVEDLNQKSLKEAWLGEKMNEIRKKHLQNDINDTPCLSCISGVDYDEKTINKRLFELSLSVRNVSKRIKNKIESLNYENTQEFFEHRAEKYNPDTPYSVTMYQDNNPQLVIERNERETAVLKPLLDINKDSAVLDIACGIGRWSDTLSENINCYCGIDFSKGLIDIARKRNEDKPNRYFFVGAANETKAVIEKNNLGKFNTILLIGILMYINDDDIIDTLEQIAEVADDKAVICIREPIGINDRLTLKNFYSSELQDDYNAIYRTKEELMTVFSNTLLKAGFIIEKEAPLFDNNGLKNRKETEQYYFILRR
jgi:wyosine [tRNA(Phe)-imidazoG37] synthetase (radical SAM superfamily)/SAM-dependent methyltransferase